MQSCSEHGWIFNCIYCAFAYSFMSVSSPHCWCRGQPWGVGWFQLQQKVGNLLKFFLNLFVFLISWSLRLFLPLFMCMCVALSCKAGLRDVALELSTCQSVIWPFEEQNLRLWLGKYGSANRGLESEEEWILYTVYWNLNEVCFSACYTMHGDPLYQESIFFF